MGIGRFIIRTLAIVGFATIGAGVHALIVPVRTGIVLPPRAGGTARAQENQALPTEQTPDTAPLNDAPQNDAAITPPADTDAPDLSPSQPLPAGAALTIDVDALDVHVSVPEAFALWSEGLADFVDTRPQPEFEAGAIPGAFHITPEAIANGLAEEQLQFLDPTRPIVVYCVGGDCHESEYVGVLLQQRGFERVHILSDGFPGWHAAGHDVQVGGGQ
ncbi:MAG: rhodanese-like domain-containing protein [Phycisphaerales bacterium]|jgi:rhodanese-related sulfurtransferase|nr:rhodanese-like domain-containing protein [Phycisphaerales bacterium]